MSTERHIEEPARRVPVVAEADVVVIGGGPGGVPAAVAAARQGLSVLVVEHYGFLGGLASAGMIGPLFGYNSAWTDELILGGIPLEIVRELQALGGAPQQGDLRWFGVPFEPEMMKHALERLAVNAGVTFLLHTHAVGVHRQEGRLDAVFVENKSGRGAVRGRLFIDATGDGDVAAFAGCAFTKGRPVDHLTQSMGTKFRLGGVRKFSEAERDRNRRLFNEAIDAGELPAYHSFVDEVSEFGATVRPNEETPTCTRARGDGTSARDLTRNEIKLRADTLKIVAFCRERIPGYENCYLMETPAQIGVRETRQVGGAYTLTADDVRGAARFEDGIARGSWFFDIHCPMGKVCSTSWCCDRECEMPGGCVIRNEHFESLNEDRMLPPGTFYEIPYRTMTPPAVDNLIVSGRSVSADHKAMASLRVIGTCFSLSEAAGTAAALAHAQGVGFGAVDGCEVRAALLARGVPL